MNRILFETAEIKGGVATVSDVRAEHILKVLHGEVGQILKTGEVNGKIGTSEITAIEDGRVTVRVTHAEESLKPWVDLILAPPRPRAMKRLLPQLAAMGVGRIFLVGAKKVEKDFWGATLLKEEVYRPLLIDGLMQSGTSILPTLETRRNLRAFVNEELDAIWPESTRIVAHPYGESCRVQRAACNKDEERRTKNEALLLAIGPEGGWTEAEVELLESKGFTRYSLGSRILRTDTATIALLARLSI